MRPGKMVPRTEAELQFEIVASVWLRIRKTTLGPLESLTTIGRREFGLDHAQIARIRNRANQQVIRWQKPEPNDPIASVRRRQRHLDRLFKQPGES